MSGLDDFRKLLGDYRKLTAWVVGVSIALPLALDQVDLTPPWPKGIVLITAVWQTLAILLSFQLGYRFSRKSATRVIVLSAAIASVFAVLYVGALSQLTFLGSAGDGERFVKGFACSDDALSLEAYRRKCPFLDEKLINAAESVEQLWTTQSITMARLTLFIFWLVMYLPVAACFATFLLFQSRRTGGPRRI
ncbi:hypothetical protein GOA58_28890 [Sinorhizobium meliloti]|uniref:hypothetical protein n=1 Tax=Rhizobium meliloti TaxID=382 RepID=UPI000FD21734|nr:hypothetical protein [Sinorhizobium meliloti]MDW9451614.1 hypothetical protein [Sinorhizobium meliloti]MDW9664647.1 hypothetical protein [Sinorhizobium meliloti]MDX0054327.1 hypothetical protein [Sinorhizobium meliloti]MQW13098.1 hypothetical protein [Sinorhizobium meliloti]RVJ41204.1 hypothetical protein CN175_33255 [Sinorhizobium meliloti]